MRPSARAVSGLRGRMAHGIMLCLNPSGVSGNPVADVRRSRIGGEQTGPGITSIVEDHGQR